MELALIGAVAVVVLLWRSNANTSAANATTRQIRYIVPAIGQKVPAKPPQKKPQQPQQKGQSSGGGGGGGNPTGSAAQGASGQRGQTGQLPYPVINPNLCKVGCSCIACIAQPCCGPAPCSHLACVEALPSPQANANITDILTIPVGTPASCTIDCYDACYVASGCSVEGCSCSGGGGNFCSYNGFSDCLSSL